MSNEKFIKDSTSSTITYYGFTSLRNSEKLGENVWRILRKDSSTTGIDDYQYPDGKDSYFYSWDDRATYTYK